MSLKIKNNLIVGAEVELSTNSSERYDDIELIVIHCISLPEGEYNNNHPKDLFLNKLDLSIHPSFETLKNLKVSSHLLINRDGSFQQFVPFNKCAWHAGQSSFEGKEDCNKFSIGIELEGTINESFTDQQYTILNEIIGLLRREYPVKNIVGHSVGAGGRKKDPGPYFEWKRIND
jgi:AmpD protein